MTQESNGSLFDLISRPILTEKSALLMEQNKYIFEVSRNADKSQVRKAIEEFFDVKVVSVNTIREPRKKKRVGRFIGFKPQYKKAIVTLGPDEKISLFPEL